MAKKSVEELQKWAEEHLRELGIYGDVDVTIDPEDGEPLDPEELERDIAEYEQLVKEKNNK